MTFALRTFRAPCAGAFRAASPALRIHSPRSLPSHLFAQSRTLRTTSRIFSAQKQEKDDAQEKQTESKTSRPSPILTVRQAAAQAAEAAKIVAARRASESGRALSEDIYTIPNALTIARIAACPALGYFILAGDMRTATVLLAAAGFTDLLDGWLARKMGSHTVFGSIADPAADKALMTVMVATLAMKGLLPMPLAVLILGRDIGLVLSAFYILYASLPPPKTFSRYWDFSLPSAQVRPTTISKYNTFLQLCLVGATTVLPVLPAHAQTVCAPSMTAFQCIVAATTVWSGASYIFSSGAVKYLNQDGSEKK